MELLLKAEKEERMEYPIGQLARAAHTSARTLRHYDNIGLVSPSRIGSNGYRYYDDRALLRLQRVLLLRELGLGLEAIGTVLAAQDSGARAGGAPGAAESRILEQHRELLLGERQRIEAQIASVDRTIAALRARARDASHAEKGASLMTHNIFEGFDHTQYQSEVEERWGADAYAKSDAWWRGLGERGQQEWQQQVAQLSNDWAESASRGEDPESLAAQALARRHIAWLRGIPGTPAWGGAVGQPEPEQTAEQAAVPAAESKPKSASSRTLEPAWKRVSELKSMPAPERSPGVHETLKSAGPGGSSLPEGLRNYVLGLADMYVADERFAANYGGLEGATFVRDALRFYVKHSAIEA